MRFIAIGAQRAAEVTDLIYFILFGGGLIAVVYITWGQFDDLRPFLWFFGGAMIAIGVVIVATLIYMSYRTSSGGLSVLEEALSHGSKGVLQVIWQIKFWLLVFSTVACVGIGETMHSKITGDNGNAFWLSNIGSRLIGGVVSFILLKYLNLYLFAVLYSGG
jgi:hypothetical protein